MLLNDMSTPSIFSSFRGTITPPSVFTLRGRPRLVACPVNAWIAIEKWYSAFRFALALKKIRVGDKWRVNVIVAVVIEQLDAF